MASPIEVEISPEPHTLVFQGKTYLAAAGTRSVLIIKSSESGGADIVARKKGELTQQDKDRLTSEGIPQHCWDDEVEMVKERYKKGNKYVKSIEVADKYPMTRQYILDKIIGQFNNIQEHGVIVHYIGPGRRDTGDWCFSDGFISFTDIAEIYMKHLTGKTLYLLCDCSCSGQWVESCKEFLDSKGVQPCGHSARKTGIKMKVYCSCQSDQIASSLLCTARACSNDKETGIPYLERPEIAPDQIACGEDFTHIICEKSLEEDCALIPNFTFQEKKKRTRVRLFTNKDKGYPGWHCVFLNDDPEFIRAIERADETIRMDLLNNHGTVLKADNERAPPQVVKDWVTRVRNGLEDLPRH